MKHEHPVPYSDWQEVLESIARLEGKQNATQAFLQFIGGLSIATLTTVIVIALKVI